MRSDARVSLVGGPVGAVFARCCGLFREVLLQAKYRGMKLLEGSTVLRLAGRFVSQASSQLAEASELDFPSRLLWLAE